VQRAQGKLQAGVRGWVTSASYVWRMLSIAYAEQRTFQMCYGDITHLKIFFANTYSRINLLKHHLFVFHNIDTFCRPPF
jgi:hypothetical protein